MKSFRIFVWLLLFSPAYAWATRDLQSLEAFDKASLSVKAVYFNKSTKQPYAVIRDPGGYVHRVYRGDYLGKNFGRVVEISRHRGVRVIEAVQGGRGMGAERKLDFFRK
ncbi:pilus assembly protein PilP [Acidovorax sp.]|uniref:pilus assembly protein PilP n=1 Tax=Acidovorax sp. TaxID=1872122 RepID=UPI003A102454